MVKIIKLSKLDINQDNFVETYQNNRNNIYFNKDRNTYYKIYKAPMKPDASKFLCDLFEQQDFLDQFCPSLVALIMNDSEHIMGYVTKKGTILSTPDLVRYLTDNKVQKLWKRSMIKYGFYYNDFKPKNLIVLGRTNKINKNTVSLIDLESIKPLASLKIADQKLDLNSTNIQIKTRLFNLAWYYKFLGDYQNNSLVSVVAQPNVKKVQTNKIAVAKNTAVQVKTEPLKKTELLKTETLKSETKKKRSKPVASLPNK